ncbi:MAG: thioredoxin family protein [Candidatus Hodarchaeales archaeon]|jgi:thioredoxin-like negative regulator of GroEL
MSVIELTDDNFEKKVTEDEKPIFITFYCNPWHTRNMIIETTVEEYGHTFEHVMRFAQIDVDENPLSSERNEIYSVPMFLILDKNFTILESYVVKHKEHEFKDIFYQKIQKALARVNSKD